MSKAFVKESESDQDDGSAGGSGWDPLPPGSKNYMTPKGADSLRNELDQITRVERPKLLETISWAAGNGDRSENGDYIYGKRRLREIDRRIRFLNKRIDALVVVDPESQKSEKILFGATVTIEDEDGKTNIYKIVGVDETDPKIGKISWVSPIGKALLNTKAGDAVTIQTPKGKIDIEVVRVEYKKID